MPHVHMHMFLESFPFQVVRPSLLLRCGTLLRAPGTSSRTVRALKAARARVQAAAAMASQDWYASSLDAFVSRGADSAKWRSQTPFDPPAVAEPLAAKDSSKAVGQKAPTSFSRDHITVSSAADVLPPLPMVQHCSSKLPLPPLNDEVVRSRLCPLQPNPLTAGGRARPRRISPLVPIEHRRDNNGLLPSRQREGLR